MAHHHRGMRAGTAAGAAGASLAASPARCCKQVALQGPASLAAFVGRQSAAHQAHQAALPRPWRCPRHLLLATWPPLPPNHAPASRPRRRQTRRPLQTRPGPRARPRGPRRAPPRGAPAPPAARRPRPPGRPPALRQLDRKSLCYVREDYLNSTPGRNIPPPPRSPSSSAAAGQKEFVILQKMWTKPRDIVFWERCLLPTHPSRPPALRQPSRAAPARSMLAELLKPVPGKGVRCSPRSSASAQSPLQAQPHASAAAPAPSSPGPPRAPSASIPKSCSLKPSIVSCCPPAMSRAFLMRRCWVGRTWRMPCRRSKGTRP